MYSPLVELAFRLAAKRHAGQVRKGSDVPYLTHPAAVALILLRSGFDDETLLAAALLHDVVEDTDCTAEQLEAEFGPAVAGCVRLLTERKLDESGRKRPWEDRKREHIISLKNAPLEARAVVLADKLHNLAAMLYDLEQRRQPGCSVPDVELEAAPPAENYWSRFNAPRERILWYHRTIVEECETDDPRLQRLAAECRRLLARIEAATENDG